MSTSIDLQPLFSDPILRQLYLDPGYSGHASDVWMVETATEKVVVRIFRWEEVGGPFWGGLQRLFGTDPRRVFDLGPLNDELSRLSPIPAPRVLRQGYVAGRPYVVVEHMAGRTPATFRGRSPAMLEALGRAMAQIHGRKYDYFGTPDGRVRRRLETFHVQMAETMRTLVREYGRTEPRLGAQLDIMCEAATKLPVPTEAGLVMVDIDPRQFLVEGDKLTALVDTEAYIVAPRELDFIGLEYVLGPAEAQAFAAGYRQILPIPRLDAVRPVYRYLYRLLEVQGNVDVDEWLGEPEVFSAGDAEAHRV